MEIANQRIQEWITNGITEDELDLSGLRLSSLPKLPNNLLLLNCSSNNLKRLQNLPLSLQKLNCYSNYLTIIENLSELSHLSELVCRRNQLTRLPTLPNRLKILKCANNRLNKLPKLPNTLEHLDFGSNLLIRDLPNLSHLINLKILYCYSNKLTNLRDLPINLQELDCGNNKLTSLHLLPNTLKILECSGNDLTSLSELPTTLQKLDCGNNKLTSLQILPGSLISLNCYNNQLPNLPDLPNNLQELNCNNNKLTSLPNLSHLVNLINLHCSNNMLRGNLSNLSQLVNLRTLECNFNELTSLSNFPLNLKELYCKNNQLTNLPTLPNSLQKLYCDNNRLTSLPNLSNLISLENLSIRENPNLVLTRQQYMDIRSLPNYQNFSSIRETEESLEESLEEETPQEVENRTNLGNTRMNQIISQNSELIESTIANMIDDDTQNTLNLPELDQKEQSIYKSRCSNTNDLIGDSLDVRYGDLSIIDISNPDKYTTYCFTYPEAEAMWDSAKTYNVHAYLGYKIDQRGVLLSKLYNTLVLRKLSESRPEGISRQIDGIKYTLDPISRRVFIREEKISPDIITNFQPTLDDLNQYYLNGKEDEFSGNIKLENINPNIYKITGKYGSIQVNKSTNKIINIIKISNSISYKITGNIINRI